MAAQLVTVPSQKSEYKERFRAKGALFNSAELFLLGVNYSLFSY